MPFTDAEYQQAIDRLPAEFTTHDFIRALSWMFQRRYIEFLYDHREAARPFMTAHGLLARRLQEWDTLESLGQDRDENIFGEKTDNVQWRKRR